MDDKVYKDLLGTMEKDVKPPAGLREKMLDGIMQQDMKVGNMCLCQMERFFFERPLKAACILSVFISGLLWAVMGKSYAVLIFNLVGSR